MALLAAVMFLALPARAWAHAEVVRTEPANPCAARAVRVTGDPACASGPVLDTPPDSIGILFSEPVSPVAGGISVRAPSGALVDVGTATADGARLDVALPPLVERGTYLVRWRVVASDTHPASGRFTFSVGEPSPVPGAADDASGPGPLLFEVVGRWLQFAGYALGFGAAAFLALVARPLGVGGGNVVGRLRGLMEAGFVVLLVAEVIAVVAQAASFATGADAAEAEAALTDVLASPFGFVVGQRLALALLLWLMLGAAPALGHRAVWLLLGLGAALAVVHGEAAHAVTVRPAWLGLAVNAVHVASMGVWLGGLVSLLAVWRLPDIAETHARLLGRFGRVAGVAVGAAVLSGVVLAAQHLGALGDLLQPGYGQALTAKLGLVGGALLLALASLRVRGPRWREWGGAELLVLGGVLLFAGLLTSLPPPR